MRYNWHKYTTIPDMSTIFYPRISSSDYLMINQLPFITLENERNTMPRQAVPMDRNLMREINQNNLINLIRLNAPVSRKKLKECSGLSWGTIVGITNILLEQQLIVETGVAESTGGRKPGLLELAPDGGYAIGISLKEYEIAGVILNLNGITVYDEVWHVPLRGNASQAVELIASSVEAFIERSQIPRCKIVGLGCGISGPVNTQAGISVDSWILNWHNVSLTKPLAERLNMPVFIDNAVNCLTCYEKMYGCGQRFQSFLLITLGRGVGLGCVLHDEIFRGANGLGAEFGHIPLAFQQHQRICECGNPGCLEEYVGDRGIIQTYRELSTRSLVIDPENPEQTIKELVLRAEQGDEAAIQTFYQVGQVLGTSLATLVNLFNPQGLLLYCGEVVNRASLLFEPLKTSLFRHIFSNLGDDLDILVEASSDMQNWARGAGCLVWQDFFALPAKI